MGLGSFFIKCKRVWRALKKPNKKEFWTTAKVAGVGILVLGIFGFVLSIFMKAFV
jgi:protein translocase SEC61 complex gamma subunit